jgi:hypothetical protein
VVAVNAEAARVLLLLAAATAIARPPEDVALMDIPSALTVVPAENHAYVEVPMRAAATRSIASAGINFFIM